MDNLNLPYEWKEYYSKYPHGFTIWEALVEWTNQVNTMVDHLNLTDDQIDKLFTDTLPENVENVLNTWYASGQLADFVNIDLMANKSDKVDYGVNIKDYGAKGNNTTDDTLSINTAAAYARTNKRALYIPNGIYKISSSLDFSNLLVYGDGENSLLQATVAEFDVVISKGNTTLRNFYIHGGWDGATPGLKGHGLLSENLLVGYSYNIHLESMKIEWCKEDIVKFTMAGYSSIKDSSLRASGLHAIEIIGEGGNLNATTVDLDNSIAGSNPNGFSVRIVNGATINLDKLIMEESKGIELAGNDNRNINIIECHEETNSTGKFVTLTGAGQHLNIIGCYGSTLAIDYNSNFYGVNILGCEGITVPSSAANWNMVQTVFNKTMFSNLKVGETTELGSDFQGWQYGHIIINGYHLWADENSNLRIMPTKNIAPTSDLVGNILARWVPVPETVASFGVEGQMAKDSNYLYICIYNNVWQRVAIATW